jgi:hypothetical protein
MITYYFQILEQKGSILIDKSTVLVTRYTDLSKDVKTGMGPDIYSQVLTVLNSLFH